MIEFKPSTRITCDICQNRFPKRSHFVSSCQRQTRHCRSFQRHDPMWNWGEWLRGMILPREALEPWSNLELWILVAIPMPLATIIGKISHHCLSNLLQATLRPVSSVELPTRLPSPIRHTLKINWSIIINCSNLINHKAQLDYQSIILNHKAFPQPTNSWQSCFHTCVSTVFTNTGMISSTIHHLTLSVKIMLFLSSPYNHLATWYDHHLALPVIQDCIAGAPVLIQVHATPRAPEKKSFLDFCS